MPSIIFHTFSYPRIIDIPSARPYNLVILEDPLIISLRTQIAIQCNRCQTQAIVSPEFIPYNHQAFPVGYNHVCHCGASETIFMDISNESRRMQSGFAQHYPVQTFDNNGIDFRMPEAMDQEREANLNSVTYPYPEMPQSNVMNELGEVTDVNGIPIRKTSEAYRLMKAAADEVERKRILEGAKYRKQMQKDISLL